MRAGSRGTGALRRAAIRRLFRCRAAAHVGEDGAADAVGAKAGGAVGEPFGVDRSGVPPLLGEARVALIDMDSTPSAHQWFMAADLGIRTFACDRITADELGPLLRDIRESL